MLNASKPVILRVDFIDVCDHVAKLLGVKDYHEIWSWLGHDEGPANDSWLELSTDPDDHWTTPPKGLTIEQICSAMKVLFQPFEPYDMILSRVCW